MCSSHAERRLASNVFSPSRAHGEFKPAAYADALDLLERGADFNRVVQDGTKLVKLPAEHWRWFSEQQEAVSESCQALSDWLKEHGADW